jgi:hypothetical protein
MGPSDPAYSSADQNAAENAEALAQYAHKLLAGVYHSIAIVADIARALRYLFAAGAVAYLFQLWLLLELMGALK